MTKKTQPDFLQSSLLLPVLLPAIIFFVFPSGTCAAESHRYIEKTGSRTTFFLWQLDMDKDKTATITAHDGDVVYVNVCDADGATREWRMRGKNSDVIARRAGNALHITGTLQGERIDERILLDDSAWFQPLSYSLRSLVLTEKIQEMTFWMIQPDSLKPRKFRASKTKEEEMAISSGTSHAVRVTICPAGLLACVWHATYWFRACDGLFLRYEGTHGPPGTPETTISLDHQPTACN